MDTEGRRNDMDEALKSMDEWLASLDEDLDVEQCPIDGDCESCSG